jgi:hypothetical protein
VEIRFLGAECRASNFGKLVWAFGECLDTIPGVDTFVETIGTGSFWVRLKVLIKNVWARDDVKEIVEKTREAVVATKLERPVDEVNKIRADTDKLREEAMKISAERQQLPDSEEARAIKELDLRRRMLENEERQVEIERKEIENRLLKLQVIERFSQLIGDGLVRADPVEIDVNGLMLLLLKDGKVTVGKGIDSIEDASKTERI